MRQLTASSALAAEARTTPGNSVWFTRLKEWNTGSWIAVVADLGLPTRAVAVGGLHGGERHHQRLVRLDLIVGVGLNRIVPEDSPLWIVSDPLGAV